MPHPSQAPTVRRPWEVARWGRLLAGASTLAFTVLGMLVDPLWHIGTLLGALNLVVTAVTDRCVLRDALLRLGAKEREDLFLPGGGVRPEARRAGRGSAVLIRR
ncbi:MAG: hypothetical protein L6R28_14105 [Planctomycetes bacterium]|nr:hypothetical protein [Planctomycetota bacterium]